MSDCPRATSLDYVGPAYPQADTQPFCGACGTNLETNSVDTGFVHADNEHEDHVPSVTEADAPWLNGDHEDPYADLDYEREMFIEAAEDYLRYGGPIA
jgi:hypothetical protein